MVTAMVMEPHTKTAPNPARSNDCFVGLLEVCELRDKDYTSHLSVDERAKYMSLRGQRRKEEWLAGRLAAKYLFLNRLEMSQESLSQRWKPTLSKLTSESLGVFSPWMYQKIEVVSNEAPPRLVWCGAERPERISLSHAGGVSCASMAFGAPTSIDLETSIPRNEAFYRNTFTEAEREWVTRGADGELSRSNWFFTLLWALKESALKLGWLKQASIWNLPRIEIDGLQGFNHIGPIWRSSKMDDAFVVCTARVKEESRVMQVQVAVTGTCNFVLTVMNPLIGAVN
ncbi:MAG: 4-phosphopantetheinyl transferase [Acidobacteriota bacterium]|nr:4-phosphopantetheinyl transferase [Acidobacteriota bacterium]